MHTISSVLNTVERGDYAFKIDLQDLYFHILKYIQQQELPTFCLRKQCISVPNTSLQSEICPSGIYSSGAHSGSLPQRQGILVIPYLDDWLIHHPDHQALLCHQSQLLDTQVGLKLNEAKSKLDPVQDIQFLQLHLRLHQGKLLSQCPRLGS